MSTVRLNPLDAAWLFTESRATPNHVGGLLQFRLPPNAPRDFLRRLMKEFRGHRRFRAPWNRRLKDGIAGGAWPTWVEDDEVDLEYHVRHSALPWPGGERELGELVGRLQSTPLDLSRPPWECTVIEGLDGGRFALFIKMHHSLIDGVSGMKLLQRSMATDPRRSMKMPPFWASGSGDAERPRRAAAAPTVAGALGAAVAAVRGQVQSAPQLVTAFGRMLLRIGGRDDGMALPFDSPLSVLNGRVREKRRFATQQFPMPRLRALAAAANCTLNDVVLALCGGALRRFLRERDSLPGKPLTAGIPVSVRPKDDHGTGNAISFIVATLGTDIAEPLQRLEVIKRSVQHAKAHVQSLPREAMTNYTMLLMAPTVITLLTGIGHPRPGAEHHLPELRRGDELRLHRLPRLGAEPAEAGGVRRRCAEGTGSGAAATAPPRPQGGHADASSSASHPASARLNSSAADTITQWPLSKASTRLPGTAAIPAAQPDEWNMKGLRRP